MNKLLKKFDQSMERLRFVHNLLIALFSGMGGIVFGFATDKLKFDYKIAILLFIILFLIIIIFKAKREIINEQNEIIEKLKD